MSTTTTTQGATTPPTITTSKKFSLNLIDLGKGLVVAAITPVVPILYQTINSGSLTFNWKLIGIAALSGLFAYLTKNFFTSSQTVITPPPSNITVTK